MNRRGGGRSGKKMSDEGNKPTNILTSRKCRDRRRIATGNHKTITVIRVSDSEE